MASFPLLPKPALGGLFPPLLAVSDPAVACWWLLELALVWVRWSAVPLCLALPLLSPVVALPLALLLALGLAVGNAGIMWLTRPPLRIQCLPLIRGLAAGLEWAAALAVIALSASDPDSPTPAVLLLLVPLTGLRFGWSGLLAAAVGSNILIGALAALQVGVLRMTDQVAATREGIGWVALITLALAGGAGMLAVAHRWRSWEETRWLRERANLRRLEYGLSFREWQILLLLAAALSHDRLGTHLGISAETVKTHVRRIGAKLGASGREAIVAAARDYGLLPPVETLFPTPPSHDQPDTEV